MVRPDSFLMRDRELLSQEPIKMVRSILILSVLLGYATAEGLVVMNLTSNIVARSIGFGATLARIHYEERPEVTIIAIATSCIISIGLRYFAI